MGNKIQSPIIHLFNEINIGKFKEVKHYQLAEVNNGKPHLPQKINISKDRSYAKSKPSYWLKFRLMVKWSNPVTGLFRTSINGYTYFGDFENKRHLVIFQFSRDASQLRVFVYPNYFPFDTKLHPSRIGSLIISIP